MHTPFFVQTLFSQIIKVPAVIAARCLLLLTSISSPPSKAFTFPLVVALASPSFLWFGVCVRVQLQHRTLALLDALLFGCWDSLWWLVWLVLLVALLAAAIS
jgi:hypothetical protein